MADRGFKISDMLAFCQCSLAIPPPKKAYSQMTGGGGARCIEHRGLQMPEFMLKME